MTSCRYDRVEILSGFANGLFLVVVSFFILLAAVSRLVHPPHINTDRLLVSISTQTDYWLVYQHRQTDYWLVYQHRQTDYWLVYQHRQTTG